MLYGYKTEVSVALTGLAIDTTDHKPGNISDLVIFQVNLQCHQEGLIKYGEDADLPDPSTSTKFPDSWAVLMDKGYQGAQQQICGIIPKKLMANFSQSKMSAGMKQLQAITSTWKIILVVWQNFGVLFLLSTCGQRKIMTVFSDFLPLCGIN